jgi:phosphatidylethanolamine/phosphatidyl-N-methylethanolamine N-methyltransferase
VTAVENDFVERVYEKLASVYDFTFGPALHPGRMDAIQRMGIKSGDRILEVGVGTGINASLYPVDCAVTGIDLSSSMLEKARDRIARKGVSNVRLLEMDAAQMKFADGTFDIVYAPYLISVVPDPVAVAREMHRVCRPGGRIVILNHFRSAGRIASSLERMIAPFTLYLGFKSDLDLPAFLVQAELKPISIEKVNVPRIWSLVTCEKELVTSGTQL